MRIAPAALFALLLGPAFAGCLGPQAPPAEAPGADAPAFVLFNGVLWTNDPAQPSASALVVSQGRIAFVGDDQSALRVAGAAARRIDLDGAFVVPGFRDQHTHVLSVVAGGDDPVEDALFARPFEPDWSPYNPAASAAFQKAMLGYHAQFWAQETTPMDECRRSGETAAVKAGLLDAQERLVKQGLTTVVEAGLWDLSAWDALSELDREGKLKMRFLVRFSWGCMEEAARLGLVTGSGSEWARVLGVKLYADGWLGPRSAALQEAYADRPLHRGFLFLSADRAERDVAHAKSLGFNVAAHAIGDRGVATMLDAFAKAGYGAEDRASLEHASLLTGDLVERMAAQGVVASIQLSFATSDARWMEQAVGAERAPRAYAWRTALDRGVVLAAGSDFPIEVINPLWGLARIVTRQDVDGYPAGGWRPQERITMEEALDAVTRGGAYASFEEDSRGRIAVGRWADLVVLRENLLEASAGSVATSTVLMTIVNGVVVFEGAASYPPPASARASAAATFAATAADSIATMAMPTATAPSRESTQASTSAPPPSARLS